MDSIELYTAIKDSCQFFLLEPLRLQVPSPVPDFAEGEKDGHNELKGIAQFTTTDNQGWNVFLVQLDLQTPEGY